MTLAAGPTVFERLFLTTVIPHDVENGILEKVAANPDFWDGADELEMFLHRSLHGHEWRWPWQEEWRQKFEALGQFPRMYDENSCRSRWKIVRDLGDYDHRVTLLCHMAHGLYFTYSRLQRSQRLEPSRCSISPAGDEPDAIQAIIDVEVRSYCEGLPDAMLPPYFPGDRTMWTFRIGSRPSPAGYDCDFRGRHFFDR